MEENQTKPLAVCRLCGKSEAQMLPAAFVRAPIAQEIKKHYPDWKPEGYICQADLNRFRFEYIQQRFSRCATCGATLLINPRTEAKTA